MTIPTSVTSALPNLWKAITQTGGKPWDLSKTVWTCALVAGSGFYPPAWALAAAYPWAAGIIVGGVFGILRVVTKGKITAS